MSRGPHPICPACPECGSRVAKKTRSDRLFTFSGDRRCTRCFTFYTPPTPRWVAYLFLTIGLILVVKTVFGLVAVVMPSDKIAEDAVVSGLWGWVCLGLVALCGLFSLWQGVRVWREKVVDPPSHGSGAAS